MKNTELALRPSYWASVSGGKDSCAVITKDELKQYKAQAVKEFAEKLWNKIKDNGIDYKIGLRALGEEIDELLKGY